MRLKSSDTMRSATEVGKGYFVKIGGNWKRISSNTATGASSVHGGWTIRTEDGCTYGAREVNRYAKAEDLET